MNDFSHSAGPDLNRFEWLRTELVGSWKWIAWVVTMMLGPGILFGSIYGMNHATGDFVSILSDRLFISNGAYEASMLGLFLLVLRRRGWQPSDLKIGIGWLTTLQGIGVQVVTYISLLLGVGAVFWLARIFPHVTWFTSAMPKIQGMHSGALEITWPVILAFTFVNAFYEEIVYMSFLFNQCAAKSGTKWAFTATVTARLAIHTYQGTSHALQIGVWAVIFALAYMGIKRVWPLILAHALIDLVSLGALKLMYG